jgi:hypothetical protein
MRGTNWIAEAPVPIAATRSPLRSWSWFHLPEWKIVPSKESNPGMSGHFGWLIGPMAATRNWAVIRSSSVSISHRCASSSQCAAVTSWPK